MDEAEIKEKAARIVAVLKRKPELIEHLDPVSRAICAGLLENSQ
jgi:hypothetical protein